METNYLAFWTKLQTFIELLFREGKITESTFGEMQRCLMNLKAVVSDADDLDGARVVE